jgi:selenide, water dikinase
MHAQHRLWLQVPHASPEVMQGTLEQAMHGAAAQLAAAGCDLVGGHSGEAQELALGFSVTGHAAPAALMHKRSLVQGDVLVLTKPLGSGIILRGAMLGTAHCNFQIAAWRTMLQSNQAASHVLRSAGVAACTDVSGFGLLGHAWEMADASQVRTARGAMHAQARA